MATFFIALPIEENVLSEQEIVNKIHAANLNLIAYCSSAESAINSINTKAKFLIVTLERARITTFLQRIQKKQ
jgi:hypothetical protein